MRYRIAIAGAGIGGLACAGLLHDAGHHVTLFDQFDAPRPVGSGLVIQPVGMAVLDRLGAGEAAATFGTPITRMLGRECKSGRRVLDVRYGKVPGLGIHRASLFQSLLEAVEARGIELRTSAIVTGQASGRLHLSDHRTEGPFDLIVDACGAGSALSPLRSRALPYGAIWGTVDWPETDLPADRLSQRYRRADRMLGILPIGQLPGSGQRKAAIFWSLPSGGHADWIGGGLERWTAEAAELWPAFMPFIEQVSDPGQMTMARYTHGTLHRPWGDGIVHIGDAAHRASPQLGQGANMALLDAAALADALTHFPLADAPRAYALGRRWHVRAYQTMSAAFTPQYQSDSRWLPVLRDRVLFPLSQVPPLPWVLSHLVSGTLLPASGSLPTPARRRARSEPAAPAR
ncbi:FAD-dependent oxidoreductase [Pelagovum pacificum]|uniref:FAD-dependent monooxygenase n=2 Tax=Pelagovum pacificum TaxID=2588711 RepID=A0A5C5GBV6_9RHOB|nr:NAD(P)/FAD-dependent oxidoreductase [Pelagovum pacificum]QQA44992.1 FAD-dependent monooxygenase [Pelagovum pacificum]TNY31077.1 FAD-dependent monooxygenase [Pelagovum pacificum]